MYYVLWDTLIYWKKSSLTHSLIYLLTYSLTHKYINTHTLTTSLNTYHAITSVTNSSSPNTPTNHPVIRTKIKKMQEIPLQEVQQNTIRI